tara:strand:+ start:141 stop:524 length:384 start_codon:yes stop_codon:yes gene_type:complete
MTYLKKNKLLIFFLLFGILQIYYLFEKRSNFEIEVLKNPFKKNSHINYVLPELVIETNQILKSNQLDKFSLGDKFKNDLYIYQRIIEYNYPIRYDRKSKFFISSINEKKISCQIIEKGIFVELLKCP